MYEGPPKINTKTYDIFCSTKRDIVSKLSRHNLAKQTQTFKYTLYPCISNNLKFKTAKKGHGCHICMDKFFIM